MSFEDSHDPYGWCMEKVEHLLKSLSVCVWLSGFHSQGRLCLWTMWFAFLAYMLLCCVVSLVTVCSLCAGALGPERTSAWPPVPIQEADCQQPATKRYALLVASWPLPWALAHSWCLINVCWNGIKEKLRIRRDGLQPRSCIVLSREKLQGQRTRKLINCLDIHNNKVADVPCGLLPPCSPLVA